jgi:hypothetical protein
MSDAEKSEPRRAKDNPWYCLATLHGEQSTAEQRGMIDGLRPRPAPA